MTLADIVRQRVAEWQPGTGRQELALADDASGWSVVVTADRRDELGCLVWELAVRRTSGAGSTLAAWAEQIAGSVQGLLEPLRVIEVDGVHDRAQLRSAEPTRRGEKVCYYELLLKGATQAVLRRYQAQATGNARREQVGFALTHDGLAKLVADLTG